MRLKKLGNKGMAIELVIITAVVVFALCSIMAIYGLKSTSIGIFGSSEIEQNLYYDQIGEDYLSYLLSKKDTPFDTSSYTYIENKLKRNFLFKFTQNENNETITVLKSSIIVFSATFRYDEITNNYEIVRWVYS